MENDAKELNTIKEYCKEGLPYARFIRTIIFNKDATKVLMMWDNEKKIYDFISGTPTARETFIAATYRILIEETGIADINLELVEKSLTRYYMNTLIHLFVTTGRLESDIKLEEGDYELLWVDANDYANIINTGYDGNNIVYLEIAKRILGLKTKLKSHIL
jgi:hypothetical protein